MGENIWNEITSGVEFFFSTFLRIGFLDKRARSTCIASKNTVIFFRKIWTIVSYILHTYI